MLKMENGVEDKDKDNKSNIATTSFDLQVKRLKFLSTIETNIPFEAVYNSKSFLKKYNITTDKINEWKEIEKIEMAKINEKVI